MKWIEARVVWMKNRWVFVVVTDEDDDEWRFATPAEANVEFPGAFDEIQLENE